VHLVGFYSNLSLRLLMFYPEAFVTYKLCTSGMFVRMCLVAKLCASRASPVFRFTAANITGRHWTQSWVSSVYVTAVFRFCLSVIQLAAFQEASPTKFYLCYEVSGITRYVSGLQTVSGWSRQLQWTFSSRRIASEPHSAIRAYGHGRQYKIIIT
jgi:hypothetical protein